MVGKKTLKITRKTIKHLGWNPNKRCIGPTEVTGIFTIERYYRKSK